MVSPKGNFFQKLWIESFLNEFKLVNVFREWNKFIFRFAICLTRYKLRELHHSDNKIPNTLDTVDRRITNHAVKMSHRKRNLRPLLSKLCQCNCRGRWWNQKRSMDPQSNSEKEIQLFDCFGSNSARFRAGGQTVSRMQQRYLCFDFYNEQRLDADYSFEFITGYSSKYFSGINSLNDLPTFTNRKQRWLSWRSVWPFSLKSRGRKQWKNDGLTWQRFLEGLYISFRISVAFLAVAPLVRLKNFPRQDLVTKEQNFYNAVTFQLRI